MHIIAKFPFRIREIRTDNGHEFQAKFHWLSRIRASVTLISEVRVVFRHGVSVPIGTLYR